MADEAAERTLRAAVDPSPDLQTACARFLDELVAWSHAFRAAHPDWPPAGHDSGTCMTPWAALVRARDDADALAFMKRFRDAAAATWSGSGAWRRGYWREQEAHHGPEHYDIFLYTLWRLDPEDEATVAQFLPAARMAINAEPDVEPWFDADAGVYRSLFLGADTVGPPAVNVPDHLRFASLALHAWEMTGEATFRDHAAQYAGRWAAACRSDEPLPVALAAEGPVQEIPPEDREGYRSFAGAAPKELAVDRWRAENLVASGAPDLFLSLWRATGAEAFREAAARILDALADDLPSPLAWQVHGGVRRYRAATGEGRWDDRLAVLPDEALRTPAEVVLNPAPDRTGEALEVGLRRDAPAWTDAAGAPAPSALLQTAGAVADKAPERLGRAVDLGRAQFALARAAYAVATAHGCGSQSVHAVARGHGRLNGCGVVTEVLVPALEHVG